MPPVDATIAQEYWAGRRAIALADRSALGRIEMAGADALDLLHRLSTQDLNHLTAGQGAGTVLTTEKGRIIDALAVHHLGARLLVVTSAGNQSRVLAWIERYTFTEDSAAADVTASTGLLAFLGPRAEQFAERLAGQSLASLPAFHHVPAAIGNSTVTLARAMEPGGGFRILVPERRQLGSIHAALLEAGADLGVRAIAEAAYDMLRVEAGLPAFGREISEQYNPLEAGLAPFISWTKGCYIGQEVVARLDAYDKVQRHLVGLILPQGPPPPSGARLLADGKEAGIVTSVAAIPGRDRPIALGYVRTPFAAPGTPLTLEGSARAEVAALPFPS